MDSKSFTGSVAVILGFYNGNKFILEQLHSIGSQTYQNIKIFIFDDNSQDEIIIKEKLSKKEFKFDIKIIKRPENIGYAKNFLLGLKEVGPNFDYYAFSDQDDIWEINKIELALKKIKVFNSSKSILYCSRTAYYSEDCLKKMGSSKIFKKKPDFRNALLQNIAGGNTILLNKKARNTIIKTLKSDEFVSHDWWCYQVISGSGGEIIYDLNKTLKYRQHNNNLIGKNTSYFEKLKRLYSFFSGNYKRWCQINIKNLYKNKELMTRNNLEILSCFSAAIGSRNPVRKIYEFKKSGVFRQSKLETIFLIVGLLLNKI